MKASNLFALTAVLVTGSCQAIFAQASSATPNPTPTQELGFPQVVPPSVPPPESGNQGVTPLLAPLPLPGSNYAPAPVFTEPLAPGSTSLNSGLSRPPVPNAATPSPDIALSDLAPANQARFRFGGILRAVYDSNIFIQSTNVQSDLYFNIAPSIAIGSGDFDQSLANRQATFLSPQGFLNADLLQPPTQPFIYLSYMPSYTAYVDHPELNTFDHDVIGEVEIILQRLTLGAFARFQTLSITNSDVGGRVREQLASFEGYAVYLWSSKTQLTDQLFVQNQNNDNFISFLEIWNEDWVDYKYSEKTSFGPGFAVGTVLPNSGPDQYYGRAQARATWKPTGKLSFAAKGGVEVRSIDGKQKAYPIYGLEGRYAMSEKTSFTLSAYQQITASADIQAINYVRNGVEASVQQKLFDRYVCSFAIGYSNNDYDESLSPVQGGFARTDNSFYVHPGFTAKINRWLDSTVSFYYQNNTSTQVDRGYNDYSATFQLTAKF